MSLTSKLANKDSWLNQFFKAEFSRLADFVKREGAAVKALPVKIPPGAHGQPTLVGMSFDYRVRLHLDENIWESPVLAKGILRMRRTGSGLGRSIDETWADRTAQLLRELPLGNESMLSKTSVVLAWLDSGFRSGGRWSDGMKAIARGINQHDSLGWDHFAASVAEDVADEVAALFAIARDHLPATGAICGPEFAGSRALGGADADLIVGNCLYDIKTTVNPRNTFPKDLRQLIGYALLDWDNEYTLEQVGFYYSRQATCVTWSLSELLLECTSTASADLLSLRGRVRTLAEKAGGR